MLAILAHASLTLILPVVRAKAPPAVSQTPAELDAITLEEEALPPSQAATTAVEEANDVPAPGADSRIASVNAPRVGTVGARGLQPAEARGAAEPHATAEGGDAPIEWAPGRGSSPAQAPVDIGVSTIGENHFLPKNEGELEEHVRKHMLKAAMQEAQRERARVLGLGPEGPVLAALAEGTSQSTAPVRGRATFVATANADAEVVSIEVFESDGERAGWADAALVALERLKGKKLRVPKGTERTVMKIEITSDWLLPNGQRPGANVSILGVPVKKGEGKSSTEVAILDLPKISVQYVDLGPGVTIPIPTFEFSVFRTNADPSNIGAQPRRVVHTRVLDSTTM